MSDREDLERYIEILSPAVRRNVEIITPNDVMGGYLFHISTNTNIRRFVPLIGFRQAKSEDRTVPRVCTAPTLLGCLIGYAAAEKDFREKKPTGLEEDDFYKGGFKIYGFEFKHALRPKKALVYDQAYSDECWLVAYNKETSEFQPINFGKVFYRSITSYGRADKTPYNVVEIYVDVQHNDGIRFSENQFLTKGYWKITGPEQKHVAGWKDDKSFTFEQISKSEYADLKNLSAGLLSYENALPNFTKW